jgi:hypothetical protein
MFKVYVYITIIYSYLIIRFVGDVMCIIYKEISIDGWTLLLYKYILVFYSYLINNGKRN